MDKIVGIGDFAVSNDRGVVIKTFALASCVAVTLYQPLKNVAGMVHVALPSALSENDKRTRPYYFANTGIPLLFAKMYYTYGCHKSELQIKLFGGAHSLTKSDVFNIGLKNIEAAKTILNGMNVRYIAEELGGTNSRTLEMEVATGKIRMVLQPMRS